ncbi:class I SAM-dependent rRNA methyltransferase [Parvibium lacunae]|uniref:Class I SAM-dependent rRNA methyltransferase n=1 Tax=Parvibium lacunae TaxID=1888893 RepID=A0A368L4X7_9BURK|nr:class I SAM-dependent rRNA methyltransferase [Parvibium lacunae]RCS58634.1 class I SAM-dependent rRNA methyltransferase [Parvibium lacunae]
MNASQTITPTLTLKPGKEKSLKRRHPWIYSQGIASIKGIPNKGEPDSGQTVKVCAADGSFLAWAAYSPHSQIRARVWSFDPKATIDATWLHTQLAAAIGRRAHLRHRSSALRLVFGEADGLPGLVVDQYGDWLSIQLLAAGVDAWRAEIVQALVAITGCAQVYERSDAAVRQREGLPSIKGVLHGDLDATPTAVAVQEDGVQYEVDIVNGHKTGFYVDQRDNRKLVADLVKRIGPSATVLNCFCYTGGFSLAALKAGATQVISVDSSGDALAIAAKQAALNGIPEAHAEWRCADVFEQLKQLQAEGTQFDIVILDPPKFAPSSHHVEKAARAYKEINLKGLRLVKPGGYLLTYSCSGAIDVDLFQKIVAGAVVDSYQDALLVQRLAAGEDHPMRMTHPEGEYLKGLLLQKV